MVPSNETRARAGRGGKSLRRVSVGGSAGSLVR
uniref:Uncharacterized protein n=1 Tax=Arundo donax TaxID=35708 RepID=A0A0A9BAU6_ARUDO